MRGRSGNALFLILIAVALFAALAYAITQSGRGSGSVSREQASLYATQIVDTANLIRQTAARMQLMGIPAADINCSSTPFVDNCGFGSANGQADFCTTGENCIFGAEGGGLPLPDLPQAAFDFTRYGGAFYMAQRFAGPTTFNGLSINGFNGPGGADSYKTGAGTAANDDILEINPLRQDVCAAINRGLGISGIPVVSTHWPNPMDILPANVDAGCVDFENQAGLAFSYTYLMVLRAN